MVPPRVEVIQRGAPPRKHFWHSRQQGRLAAGVAWLDGRLKASSPERPGTRCLGNELAGVYMHKDSTAHKANSYIRFVPLFRDGVYWAAKWQLQVDRSDRVPCSRKSKDQWVNHERSVRLQALWLCGKTAADMDLGVEFVKSWEPSLESNPNRVVVTPAKRRRL